MCLPKKNSFKRKMSALMSKGRLSGTLLFYGYDQDMSDMRSEARYWILVFARRSSYVFKNKESNWLSMIKVWDTAEDKWINTITLNYYMHASTSCVAYDHEHELIMFSARSTSYHRAYIYSFFKSTLLANPRIQRTDKDPDKIKWQIVDHNYLLFNDDSEWHMYCITDLKNKNNAQKHTYEKKALYNIEYVFHPHPKITVLIANSGGHDAFYTAIVLTYKEADDFSQFTALPFTMTNDVIGTVKMTGTMLMINSHSIDVSRFIV